MPEIAGSGFMDFNSWSLTNETSIGRAFGYGDEVPRSADGEGRIAIGLVLERNVDPSNFLNLNWGDRQKEIARLEGKNELWTMFGANGDEFHKIKSNLEADGINILNTGGFVSTPESRTIWIDVNAEQFKRIFGTDLLVLGNDSDGDKMLFWQGTLSTKPDWNIAGEQRSAITGLWLDSGEMPIIQNLHPGTPIDLPQGPQSIGNLDTGAPALRPYEIAEIYNFPLRDPSTVTGIAGVMEPGVGDATPWGVQQTFQEGFNYYRSQLGLDGPLKYYLGPYQNEDGWKGGDIGERNMDVGILTAINPNATIGLYAGPQSQTFYPALQSAIWDTANNIGVLSSSFSDYVTPAPGSPWMTAYHELYLDMAFRNITMFQASNDAGSGYGMPNGLTNPASVETGSYIVVVGGTSLSIPSSALRDTTLSDIVERALSGDRETLRLLVATGLTTFPGDAPHRSSYIETAWNQMVLTGDTFKNGYGYYDAASGNGGVDLTSPVPDYQLAYGLRPVDAATDKVGRGEPDVSAGAGGNISYLTPNDDFSISFDSSGGIGTSASAPLWTSLGLQIQTIFEDQGLPRPGYMNDLLYTAAVVAPASFNDITLGNNISSMTSGGPIHSEAAPSYSVPHGTHDLTPTGLGYEAGPGYDLVTGLGSPNGLLLARAVSAIAHSQMWFDTPDLISQVDGRWEAGATQSLLLQPTFAHRSNAAVSIDGLEHLLASTATSTMAWSDQLAQQTLQPYFSADLVRLFDKDPQGTSQSVDVAQGDAIGVVINGAIMHAPQASLSSALGFVDFDSGDSGLRIARPLAVAETADGADDVTAIVRLRQNGTNDLSIMFYEVDDLAGTINGLAPGSSGYQEAVEGRAYRTVAGDTWVHGAGYGEFRQTGITGVDAGDLVAMKITNGSDTFFGFSQANEQMNGNHVGHLWNYGLNTWGWEDIYGGGDLDYNDLVVQLDFTSTSGHGWLV